MLVVVESGGPFEIEDRNDCERCRIVVVEALVEH